MAGSKKRKIAPPHSAREGVVDRLHRAWGESPFYQAQLKGPAPDRFYHMPIDPRTPDRSVAEMLVQGKLTIGSEQVNCDGELEKIWDLVADPGPLHSFLHDFVWLRHMTTLDERAKEPAILLTNSWLDRHEKWSLHAWSPYLTAERLTQLCCYGGVILKGEDPMWRSRVLTSMARQTRHLAKTSHRATTGFERLMTAMGLCIAGLCLPGCDMPFERGLEILRRELRLQIRPDGGHTSRNPSHQLSIVLRLRMVLQAMETRRMQAPGFLQHVSVRTTSFLQMFRSGDGRMAIFNGGYEDDGRALVSALSNFDEATTPTGFARHSGFQRLDAGRLTLIADTGMSRQAVKSAHEDQSHSEASFGSFHLSSSKCRLVVNCGSGAHLSSSWLIALKSSDAHSKLVFDPTWMAEMSASGAVVSHRRGEDSRGQLLEIERKFGTELATHIRRFFIAARGDDIRGQDHLTGFSEEVLQGLSVRFHLHPSVKASAARDGSSVLLLTTNREAWRFRANCGPLSIEKSIYSGEGGLPVATEQIVLRPMDLEGSQEVDMVIKWGFRRDDSS